MTTSVRYVHISNILHLLGDRVAVRATALISPLPATPCRETSRSGFAHGPCGYGFGDGKEEVSDVIAWLWKLFPVGRVTAAWWAWRNRRELSRWLQFAWRAVPPSAADRNDLVTEARLRAALARDPRTRGAPSLSVRVLARTAFLGGSLTPDVHDLVASIAGATRGILRVECGIRDRGRRRNPVAHAHAPVSAPPVNALPPPPG
jgi:hypothetical protein